MKTDIVMQYYEGTRLHRAASPKYARTRDQIPVAYRARIRYLPDNTIRRLDQLDAQVSTLQKEIGKIRVKQEILLSEGYDRGRDLTLNEILEWQEFRNRLDS